MANPVQPPSCTTEELEDILMPDGFPDCDPDDYNEVYANIILGDGETAKSLKTLKDLGITHVLNAAWGTNEDLGFVDTQASTYEPLGMKFLGIQAKDLSDFNLSSHFNRAADFIESGLSSNGKVYVHCYMGISRSASIVIAYLMIKKGMSVKEAVTTVRSQRSIIPNKGFLTQLCQLNDDLRRTRGGQ